MIFNVRAMNVEESSADRSVFHQTRGRVEEVELYSCCADKMTSDQSEISAAKTSSTTRSTLLIDMF